MKRLIFLAVVSAVVCVSSARASTVMTFEGLGCEEAVANYYNGGLGGDGSGPGPSDGVVWSSNSIALTNAPTCGGNFTNAPSGDTVLVFLSGTGDTMDVASGITTGFSFFYSGNPQEGDGSVDIYAGLDGTGALLGSFVIDTSLTPICTTGPSYCVWQPDGVDFSGTAESVVFGGAADFIGFDNITLGSSTPGTTVPEPSSLMLLGTGLLGLLAYAFRRRGGMPVANSQ